MKISKELKVSFAAIVAIVLLFYGINFLKGRTLVKKNTYVVVFDNVTGLTADNAVFANGYSVGSVNDITINYEKPEEIYVSIAVDKSVRIPRGTHAEIETSMMGTTTMRLLLSDSREFLSPGDSLTGSVYKGALDQAGALVPQLEAMLPKLDSIVGAVNALMNDPKTAQLVANAEMVTRNLVSTTDNLNNLLEGDIPRLTARLDAVGANVETLTCKLNEIDYAETVRKVDETLRSTDQLLSDLDAKLNSTEGTVGLLLNDRRLYDNLNNTLVSSDSLLQDLKSHPKRYVHFSLFGKKDK